MSRRKLTKEKIAAMRGVIERTPIFNRGIAQRLREVQRDYPEYLEITPPAKALLGAQPFFFARLTIDGLDAITPRKLVRRNHTIEVRA